MSQDVRIIDIPAGQVREMNREYFESNYKRLDNNGNEVPMSEAPYIVVRNKDAKVFRVARFVPYGWQVRDYVYLEEL